MKVAIFHDSLSEFGGAERVLIELIKLFPQANLYTSYVDKEILKNHFPSLKKSQNLFISWYQWFPRKTTTTTQLLSPLFWKFNDLNNYNLIFVSSSYYLCPLTNFNNRNVVYYLHSIPKNLFGLEKKSTTQSFIFWKYHQIKYIKSIKKSRLILTNSKHTQNIVKDFLNINSKVIYPPVFIPKYKKSLKNKKKFFLVVSRIDETKGLELAIKACSELNLPLVIAGKSNNQSYLKYLKSISGKKTKFLGFVSERLRNKLYKNAIAFLFCSKNEDFGIAPVEAMAYGIPVVAFNAGGIKETLIHKETGILFNHYSWQSMAKSIKIVNLIKFNKQFIVNHAKKFSSQNFTHNIKKYLIDNKLYY